MRLSRLVAQAEAPREELVAPSPAHEAFVSLIGDLAGMMGNSHPAAKILKRLLPSLLKDLVELDEGLLRRACADLAIGLRSVAEAPIEATAAPSTIEVDASEEPELEPRAGAAIAALPTG